LEEVEKQLEKKTKIISNFETKFREKRRKRKKFDKST